MVPRRIVNWFNNGKAEKFLQFSVAKSGKNGLAQFAATENHLVRTPGGWRQAGELIPGDRVMATEQQRLGDQQIQLILGSLMGDGNLSPNRRGRSGTRFRMGHGAKQAAYLDWKRRCWRTSRTRGRSTPRALSSPTSPPCLSWVNCTKPFTSAMARSTSAGTTSRASRRWRWRSGTWTTAALPFARRESRSGPREVPAGSEICVEAMSPGSRDRLARYLRDTHGLEVKLVSRGARQMSVLQFSTRLGEVPEAASSGSALCPPVHGVQAVAAVPWRV